jgi:hypothetical protein
MWIRLTRGYLLPLVYKLKHWTDTFTSTKSMKLFVSINWRYRRAYRCKPSFREQKHDPEMWIADIMLYLWQRRLSINNSKQRKSAPLCHSLVTWGLYSEILKYEYGKMRRWPLKGNVLWNIRRLRIELYWERPNLFISYLVGLIEILERNIYFLKIYAIKYMIL